MTADAPEVSKPVRHSVEPDGHPAPHSNGNGATKEHASRPSAGGEAIAPRPPSRADLSASVAIAKPKVVSATRWFRTAGFLLLGAAILALGFGGMQWLVATSPRPLPVSPERPAVPVEVLHLQPRTVVEPLLGFGTARSERFSVVAAEIPGRIQSRSADLRPGARVSADAKVLQIDPRDYQARLERVTSHVAAEEALLIQIQTEKANVDRLIEPARADFEAARREHDRLRALLEAGNSNPRELDSAQRSYEQSRSVLIELENQLAVLPQRERFQAATLEQRRAELNMAKIDLQRCDITPPFDGQIETVQVEAGAAVVPGQPLFSILDPQHLEIPIELPVAMFDRVRVGAPCELQLETNSNVIWRGEVKRISASADVATRTFAAYVLVDNSKQPQPLTPGMFVQARIHGPKLENALIVPREAVQHGCVYILRDGAAVRTPVRVERRLVEQCAISGVQPGEQVIVSNFGALFDGARVRPSEPRPLGRVAPNGTPSQPPPGPR